MSKRIDVLFMAAGVLVVIGVADAADASSACQELFRQSNTPASRGDKTKLDVRTVHPQFRYHSDKTRAELGRLHGKSGSHAPGTHVTVQGLTVSRLVNGIKAEFAMIRLNEEYSCVWPSAVEASVGYETIDVYVAAENPHGSCAYDVTLDHENEHVKITVGVFNNHLPSISQNLRRNIDALYPAVVRTEGANDKALELIVRPFHLDIARMEGEQQSLNAALDSPESYRLVTAKCAAW